MTRTILFFGDSLTAGYGVGAALAFPALLQAKLDAEVLPYRAINAGRSGDTSSSGRARLTETLAPYPRPDVFVLELGANDGLRGHPPATTRANLDAILTTVRHKHPAVRCLLLGMALPPLLGGPSAAAFAGVFGDVAAKHNCAFLPFLLDGILLNPALTLADHLHPNAAGQRRMADVVWPVLRPMLLTEPPMSGL
ncbi:MAG: arylesterase [Hymenobacteraceae bacterium]|nr:arylesterase [Hymenobacteraceae bacterium]